jgi:mRNA interferase MazF
MYRFAPPDKRRPVVVLSRTGALAVLNHAIVASITSTIREAPSEVALGIEHGMKGRCVVNLDHVHTVRQEDLRAYVTTLPPDIMTAICRALATATGCR